MTSVTGCEELASRYRRFALSEASGRSPLYEHLSMGVAGDPTVLGLLAEFPTPKQQPNLLLAAYRHVLGVPSNYAEFRRGLTDHFDAVRTVMLERSTQTNEPGRCASLLPILASLRQPLALLEVGASAGLCLFPDRYGYDYPMRSLRPIEDAHPYPVFSCDADVGVLVPGALPQVVWRAGLDLNPLNAGDPNEAAWLEMLVWPEQEERRIRLRLALDMVVREKPNLVRGDLLGPEFEALCRQAPDNATLVVFHTAVLAYVSNKDDRTAFAERALALADTWICNEAPSVTPHLDRVPAGCPSQGAFLLSVNQRPVAWTDPHGAWIEGIAENPISASGAG